MIPAGAQRLTSSSLAVQGSTTEKTFCSRMRRAISCVYCAPKSRMTIVSSGEVGLAGEEGLCLDWFSTDEFLKTGGLCKEKKRPTAGPNTVRKSVVILSGVLCREGPMHFAGSIDAVGECIDPSVRRVRGLQDDKRHLTTRLV